MKVTELRKLINQTKDDVLKKAFIEVYKLVPTGKRGEADFAIENVLRGNSTKTSKPVNKVDYTQLSNEIYLFLENAYAQNYFKPNRYVPKKERSKWRFHVKRFVKELSNVSFEDEFYNEAVELLTKLYKMMCYGCNYYLFSSDDTFQSVGISQHKFYSLVVEKTLALGITNERISSLIVNASTGGLSRTSLHEELLIALLSYLNINKDVQFSILQAKELVESKTKKSLKDDEKSDRWYFQEEELREICNFILIASIKLGEFDDGLAYYFDHLKERDRDIALYCALFMIQMYTEDDELWIHCYEYGVKKRKIKPRDQLKETYNDLLKHKM